MYIIRILGQAVLCRRESPACTFKLGHTLRRAVLLVLLMFSAASSEAQPAVRQVLVLQSFERGIQVLDYLTGNLRVDLDERIGSPVHVVQVVVSPSGAVGAPEQTVVDFLRATYAARRGPDLIVTFAGPATVFARKHRAELFPDAPLLIASVDQRYLRDAPPGENETVVAVDNDIPRLVDEILQLLPATRQVFMVVGGGQIGAFWQRELERDFRRFDDRLTFVWSGGLSLAEIVRRCATLPSHSAILYISFGTDAEGGMYPDERVLAELHAKANAPVFGVNSVLLGSGIVGGTLMANEQSRRNVADAAIRLLNGVPPASLTVPTQRPGPPIFDWRQLQRWGIAETRLPAGSIVRYRPPSLWSEHGGTVLTAAGALAVQSLLIVGLLYQRRARQRAERDSRRNLALAADASRRETMSALTSSIGHELGQPLGSILHNAQALRMMVTANRATPETIEEILADIQAQGAHAGQIIDRHRTMLKGRQMDRKPIDLHAVIAETVALVAHDMSARQVEATVHLSSTRCVVNGDQVLLQQVFVNLVMNAMDAMAETPPARRHITISSDVRATDVDVSVRDTGPGLPAEIDGTLFTPFVTTKAHGLGIGLTIVRSILDAHDGTIVARNNPDGGATFTVRLPRSESATVVTGALH
jgi:signal transduction histidine kinase